MAARFIVETVPVRFFAFTEPSTLLPFNDPRHPPATERIGDVVVRPFYGRDAERFTLAHELSRLIDDVYRETADPPDRVQLGRHTFLELAATLQILQEEQTPIHGSYSAGEGTIFFRGVRCVLTPGEEHHAEAVPFAAWLLSRDNPKRFILERPTP